MGKLMKNGRIYGGHSTTAATVTYTDTNNIGATNTQDALDKVAQRVINQSTASGVSYTDTNNIGATNVQSAVDFFGAYSEGQATINTTYLSGQVNWQKFGRVVSVAIEVSTVANLPSSNWEVALISGLPPVLCPMSWIRRWTLPATDQTKKPLILGATATTTMPQTILYSWGNGGVTSGTAISASFTYICK